jgi:hypothetical protein
LPKTSPNKQGEKGKSGQLKIAVSGSFGGGVLLRFKKAGGDSFGGTGLAPAAIEEQHCELLIVVLTGLGGASQERSAARIIICEPVNSKS